jgi:tetratricopeptide (TPR) repeat protein
MRKTANVLERLLFFLAAALLLSAFAAGCGGAPKAKKAAATTAGAETGETAEEEEDLTQRKPVEEKIIKYVEGVEEGAQDLFREGIAAALKVPPDYDLAQRKFSEAIEADASFLEAYTNLGKIHERMRRTEQALAVYRRALKANPENLDAQAYVGKIYLVNARAAKQIGNDVEYKRLLKEAKDTFDTVVARDADNVAVNNALALYWLIEEDLDKAEEQVVRVLAVNPANTEGLNTRGLLNLMRGDLKITRWIFAEKVMSLDPNSPEAYTNLGVTHARLGNLPAAVASFTKAIELDPENLPARTNLAAIQLNWLDYEGAGKQYAFVIGRQPDNVEALIGLGSTKMGQRKFKDAVAAYDKVRKIDSRRNDMLLRVAKIYEENLSDTDNAIKIYEEYVKAEGLPPDHQIAKRVVVLKQVREMENAPPEAEPSFDDDEPKEGDEGEKAPEGAKGVSEEPAKAAAPEKAPAPAAEEEKKAPAVKAPAAVPSKAAPPVKAKPPVEKAPAEPPPKEEAPAEPPPEEEAPGKQPPSVEKAPKEEAPAKEPAKEEAPAKQPPLVEEAAPTEEKAPPTEAAPPAEEKAKEEAPAERTPSTEEKVPAEEKAPAEEAAPAEEKAPAEEAAPAEEKAPAEEAPPAAEEKAKEEAPAERTPSDEDKAPAEGAPEAPPAEGSTTAKP